MLDLEAELDAVIAVAWRNHLVGSSPAPKVKRPSLRSGVLDLHFAERQCTVTVAVLLSTLPQGLVARTQ